LANICVYRQAQHNKHDSTAKANAIIDILQSIHRVGYGNVYEINFAMEILLSLEVNKLLKRLLSFNDSWSPMLIASGLQRLTGVTTSCEFLGENYRKNQITNLMTIVHSYDRIRVFKVVKTVSWDHAVYADTETNFFSDYVERRYDTLNTLEKSVLQMWIELSFDSTPKDSRDTNCYKNFMNAQGSLKRMVFKTASSYTIMHVASQKTIIEDKVEEPKNISDIPMVPTFYSFSRFKSEKPLVSPGSYNRQGLDNRNRRSKLSVSEEKIPAEAIDNIKTSSTFVSEKGLKRSRDEIKEEGRAKTQMILDNNEKLDSEMKIFEGLTINSQKVGAEVQRKWDTPVSPPKLSLRRSQTLSPMVKRPKNFNFITKEVNGRSIVDIPPGYTYTTSGGFKLTTQ
jgi:hypothetical protein